MAQSMRIFDASARIGPARDHIPGAPRTAGELLRVMDDVGISDALVWHADAQHYDSEAGNTELLDELSDTARLYPCWVFLPHETGECPPPATYIRTFLDAGVRAARLFPYEHLFSFRLWNIGALCKILAFHRIPVFVDFGIHSWGDKTIDWNGLFDVGKAYPHLPIIITKINIGSDRHLLPLMQQLPNLYVETSYYTVHRGIELIVSKVGPQRILFGTGLPLRAPGPALTALQYSLINDKDKGLVAGDNLRRLIEEVRV